ncbi:hypothetical protein SBDP1_1010009 [Syntrophobacter sp. SbD1]|nr:hypothetical protein SBDP1_1010009 [Syntrophobacter sp. SbD1]
MLSLGFLEFFIFSTESFNASGGIDQLLFSSIERVALGTYFHTYLLFGGPYRDFVAACAFDCCLVILGMNVLLHRFSFLILYTIDGLNKSAPALNGWADNWPIFNYTTQCALLQ